MKDKLLKIVEYIDLYELSKKKEEHIKTSPFYIRFGRYNQMEEDLSNQRKVTNRIANRIKTLKDEL